MGSEAGRMRGLSSADRKKCVQAEGEGAGDRHGSKRNHNSRGKRPKGIGLTWGTAEEGLSCC